MRAVAVPSELEAKLLAEEADLRALARRRRLGPYRLLRRAAVRLHSLYLDTADLQLVRHRVALRVRQCAGEWEATAKWAGQRRGAVHERPELTVSLTPPPEIPFVLPAGPLRRRLQPLVGRQPLAPMLITDIRRRRLHLLAADAAAGAPPLAELALDRVHLRIPGDPCRTARYCEIEIERLHGTRRDIVRVARLLRQAYGLAPSRDSKFARGLALRRNTRASRRTARRR